MVPEVAATVVRPDQVIEPVGVKVTAPALLLETVADAVALILRADAVSEMVIEIGTVTGETIDP